jgi:UDP-glucose 4-epimerase
VPTSPSLFELARAGEGLSSIEGDVRDPVAVERALEESRAEIVIHFLYLEDAVSAYIAVAESLEDPNNRGRAWNAGLGHPVSVDVEPDIRGEGALDGEVPRYWLDSTAIRRELGWSPEWDLVRGLEATYDWYAASLRGQVWE